MLNTPRYSGIVVIDECTFAQLPVTQGYSYRQVIKSYYFKACHMAGNKGMQGVLSVM